jgi:alpha-beta hydrolase superfamily lysophospholipase
MHSLNDRMCFPQLQPTSFQSFLGAGPRLFDPRNLGKLNPDLPIYLFSGSEDPVGQELAGIGILLERYRKAGLHDISHDFYSGGRHEMVNEITEEKSWQICLAGYLSCWKD